MTLKPDYKQTEVGLIPEDWEQTPLRKACTLLNGRAYALHEWETAGVPVIRLQNLTGGDKYYYSTLQLPEQKYCCRGDLLYMWSATFGPHIWMNERAIYHYHIWKVVPNAQRATRQFLYYKLQEITEEKKARATNGGTMLHVTKSSMESSPLALPPLPEQRAIAGALSDVDAMLGALDQLIAKKRDLKQAAMQQLLTGQTRLPGFRGEWQMKRLDKFAPLQRGFDLTTPQIRKGDFPVVYSNGVQNYHEKFMVKAPGVVTGRSGTIGNVHFVEQDYWPHNTALWVTDFQDNNPKFVFYLLTSIGLYRFATGSGVPTLNRNDVHEFRVSVPPAPAEQTAIAEVLSDMDAELAALEQRRAKTHALKQGMMQELLTGRTRLV